MPPDPVDEIGSVEDLLGLLQETAGGELRWFRGHTDSRWRLVPSLARRREWLESEVLMLKRFKQDAYPRLREHPQTEWDWLFLAQHHGLPTRLLDWSQNPLIGLYFAVESDAGQDDEITDGRLWALRPVELNGRTAPDIPAVMLFGYDPMLDTYLPDKVAAAPAAGPLAATATRSFARIVAQSGTFTVNHRRHEPLEEIYEGSCVDSYIVPMNKKAFIREQLAALNINSMTVYPDLTHLGSYVKGQY